MKRIIKHMNRIQEIAKRYVAKFKATHQQQKSARELNEFLTVLKNQLGEKDFPYYETVVKNAYIAHQTYQNGKEKHPLTLGQYLVLTTRVMQQVLVSRHIIGIQPMSGPVGLTYSLQYKKIENSDNLGKFNLEVISSAVEARSRMLKAAWCIEAMTDMAAVHNIDIEAEMVAMLSAEIGNEVIAEIVNDITKLANMEAPYEVQQSSDPLKSLALELNRASNDIARKTKRGLGNVIITSPVGLSILQSPHSSYFEFKPTESKGVSSNALVYAGDLFAGGTPYKVLVTLSLPTSPDSENTELFIVGYKGGNSEIDVGYTYCPYLCVLSRGIAINPTTFQPFMGFMTRYGKQVNLNEGVSNSSNYYRAVKFNTKLLDEPKNEGGKYDPLAQSEDFFFPHPAQTEGSGSHVEKLPDARLAVHKSKPVKDDVGFFYCPYIPLLK